MVDSITFDLNHTDMLVNNSGEKTIYKLTPHQDISKEDLLALVKQVYDMELQKDFDDVIYLNLREVSVENLAEVFKYAFGRDDIKDPITILNIINLIKIYNALNDTFFANEHIWFTSLEKMLDLKLLIHTELKQFIRQFSIYFLSLIKSYNKLTYTPIDNNIELPQLYQTLFESMDFMTAAGVFSVTKNINSDELVLINNSIVFLSEMMVKNCMGMSLLNEFLEETEYKE